MRKVSHQEFIAEISAQGVPSGHIAYACPVCGTIQSCISLIRAGAGLDIGAVSGKVGFSCVGRFTGAGSYKKGAAPGRGCSYTLGGFLKVHTYCVIADNDVEHPLFEPALPAQAQALYEANRPLGTVQERSVFKGDVLYVDIRGTCAETWGKGKVAAQGANEGQGAMIVFEDGDYRKTTQLVWRPVGPGDQ